MSHMILLMDMSHGPSDHKTYQGSQTEMNSRLIRVFSGRFRGSNWTFSKLRNRLAPTCGKLLGTRQFLIHPNSLLGLQGPPNSQIHRPKLPNQTRRERYFRIIRLDWKYLQCYFGQRTSDLLTSYLLDRWDHFYTGRGCKCLYNRPHDAKTLAS